MKTNKTRLIFGVFALLLFVSNTYGQEPTTHYVTLYVDTSVIDNDNVDAVSNFGQENGETNRDYTITVQVGDFIIWRGVSTSSEDDIVNIKSINHEGGKNMFDQNILRGNGEEPEIVVGEISNGQENDVMKYKVSFKVLNDGNRRGGTYHIDPKIQIKK